MANRPCKPGADVKGIWQLLLPDTPFPACGTRESADAHASANGAPVKRDDAETQERAQERTRERMAGPLASQD